MKINEMFPGIQGEGYNTGMPAYFVRLSGCNAKCDFCDTKYHKNGNDATLDYIVSGIKQHNLLDVIITGGEPLLQISEIENLIYSSPMSNFHLETNGSLYNDIVKKFRTISCSPKQQMIKDDLSSYNSFRVLPQTTFKFVYETKDDLWWEDFMEKTKITPDRVWIMPEGATRDEQIKKMPEVMEYCLKKGFNFSPRLHVLSYDTRRGV